MNLCRELGICPRCGSGRRAEAERAPYRTAEKEKNLIKTRLCETPRKAFIHADFFDSKNAPVVVEKCVKRHFWPFFSLTFRTKLAEKSRKYSKIAENDNIFDDFRLAES